ncbi:hypothetical protein E3O53_07925 [Cryobacterium sp. TMT2-18-3]|uniref:hypothetical protein n=1 Tax=unclassified Cryobacterium TaxID=2649013 RepID=UPI00106C8AAB|nr:MULTISPECIES: hypothetical protein [unclassified Cryobacterium]TFC26425.1 hypothetical protein E3O22_12385 [Cryobacterium sp. TMT2-18-2]TFC64397.1 hypothetical protein E3O53_07925 [Cryobacterium sp. TMT2-18-3]
MMDDGLGPSRADISSPRFQYIGVTELEVMKIRLHNDGTITGGIQRLRGAMGPHASYIGHILPLLLFEMVVGEVGWLRFKPRRPWVGEELTAVTLAPVLWIDAQPLPY